MTTFHTYYKKQGVRPSVDDASLKAFTPRDVAKAYNFPENLTGKGFKAGIIELGGGFGQSDLNSYFGGLGLPVPNVTSVPVDGGRNQSDGPNGADGEVLLDIEVVGAVAPGADIRVYFGPNSDSGFLAAINQAVKDECDVISISWGQAENQWSSSSLQSYDAAFAAAREAGITIFCASGDSGADDSTGSPVTDFPASSPNVVGCGGTRLTTNSDGSRATEVTWDDNDTSSATGGGISKVFPGRNVPDVAGNADPYTGYKVLVDGESFVIGGTSAVAPLYAGLALLLSEAVGQRVGKAGDFLNTALANISVFYDVTAGDNGAYRAGPGRDQVTGFGVADGGRLEAVYTALSAPVSPPQPPTGGGGTPTPPPTSTGGMDPVDDAFWAAVEKWTTYNRVRHDLKALKQQILDWHEAKLAE